MTTEAHQSDPLDYAHPHTRPRVSKLAAALPILAFAACPCLTNTALVRVMDAGIIIHHTWAYRLFLPFVLPSTVLALGMIALLRVRYSRDRLLGAAPANFSIILCALWIVL